MYEGPITEHIREQVRAAWEALYAVVEAFVWPVSDRADEEPGLDFWRSEAMKAPRRATLTDGMMGTDNCPICGRATKVKRMGPEKYVIVMTCQQADHVTTVVFDTT